MQPACLSPVRASRHASPGHGSSPAPQRFTDLVFDVIDCAFVDRASIFVAGPR